MGKYLGADLSVQNDGWEIVGEDNDFCGVHDDASGVRTYWSDKVDKGHIAMKF